MCRVASSSFNGTCYRITPEESDKPVIVIVHGVGLNQDMWLSWLPTLAEDYRVLTLDLYGHGGSCNPEGERTVRDFVDQINELLDHLDIDQISLAGFSLGAVISQAYASLYPERLTHLILLHSVYQRTDEQCKGVRERYLITRDEGPMPTVELAIRRWYTDAYRISHPDEMDGLREVFSKHTDGGYLKAYYLFGHAEAEMSGYGIEQVQCPALVITGADDVGSTPAMSEALARDLPDSRLIVNPLHRHMGPAEFADDMSHQVLSFLNNQT
jgi:pimeloyl-ACP methyl ester carboxylesterase